MILSTYVVDICISIHKKLGFSLSDDPHYSSDLSRTVFSYPRLKLTPKENKFSSNEEDSKFVDKF